MSTSEAGLGSKSATTALRSKGMAGLVGLKAGRGGALRPRLPAPGGGGSSPFCSTTTYRLTHSKLTHISFDKSTMNVEVTIKTLITKF